MKTKAKYKFIEFVRPDGYWPCTYTVEQAFGVLKWMLQTGQGYNDSTKWGTQSIESLLSCKPTCVNFRSIEPIVSLEDLQRRFHYAILSGCVGDNLRQWRADYNIHVDGAKTIAFSHGFNGSYVEFAEGVSSFLATTGTLKMQLNEYHPRAKRVNQVTIETNASAPGWRFVMYYGYQGSRWEHVLARQTASESFSTAFRRAKNALADLMTLPGEAS